MGPGSRVVAITAVAIVVAAGWVSSAFLDVGAHVDTARRWAVSLGPLAPGAYAGLAVIATLVGVPAAPIAVLAALLFGPLRAAAVIVSASIASACLAFWLARQAFRRLPGAPRRADALARFGRLMEAHEPAAILLIRMIPVLPFTVINYGLGLTQIRFSRYLLWSVIAIVPADAALVFWADGLYAALANRRVDWMLAAIAAAAACAVGALLLARRLAALASADRALHHHTREATRGTSTRPLDHYRPAGAR